MALFRSAMSRKIASASAYRPSRQRRLARSIRGERAPGIGAEDPLDPAAELLEVPGSRGPARCTGSPAPGPETSAAGSASQRAIRGPRTPRRRAPDGPGNRPVRGPRWAVGRTDDPGRGGRIARPPPGEPQLLGEAGDRLQPPVVPGGEPLEGRRGLRVPPAGAQDPGLDLHERRRLRGPGPPACRGRPRPRPPDRGGSGAEIIGQGLRGRRRAGPGAPGRVAGRWASRR